MRGHHALAAARRWGERWMQSGLARDALALMAFMVAALLGGTVIFDRLYMVPRMDSLAAAVDGHLGSMIAAVRSLPEHDRDDFLRAVEKASSGYLFVDEPTRWRFSASHGAVRARFLRLLSERLPQESINFSDGKPSMLWLAVDNEQGRTRWVRMAMPEPGRTEFNFALSITALFSCFGFAGALFLLLRVRRSLSGVDEVVAQLEGKPPSGSRARRVTGVAARLARAHASQQADLLLAGQELARLNGHLREVAIGSPAPAPGLLRQLDERLGQFDRHIRAQGSDAVDRIASASTARVGALHARLRTAGDFLLVLMLAAAAMSATGWATQRFIVDPRTDDAARILAMQINSMRAISLTLPRDRLQAWLDDLNRYSQGTMRADDPSRHVTGEPAGSAVRWGMGRLRELVPGVPMTASLFPSPYRAFWFLLPTSDGGRWVSMRTEGLLPPMYPFLLAGAGLTLGGAAWIVLRAHRRVRRLAGRVEQIEAGMESEPPGQLQDADDPRSMDPQLRETLDRLVRAKEEQSLVLADLSLDMRSLLLQLRETRPPREAGLQAMTCIDQMLQLLERLNRFAPGQDDPTLEPVDLNMLLSDLAAGAGESVRLRLEGQPFVRIRPADVARMLGNLVDNALRHGAPPVTLTSSLEGGWVVLRVLDRGPGLPDKARLQLEQPGARMQERAVAPSGIGLAVSRHIAEAHGGLLRLLRREGGGLQAEVWLPPARLPLRPAALEERVL